MKPEKDFNVRLQLDKTLKGLQFVANRRVYGLLKRRFRASGKGNMVVSNDGGLFFYMTEVGVPWIGIYDHSLDSKRLRDVVSEKIFVSEMAMMNAADWLIEKDDWLAEKAEQNVFEATQRNELAGKET